MLHLSSEEDKQLVNGDDSLEAMLKLCMEDFPELKSEELSEENHEALRIASQYIKDETKVVHTRFVSYFLNDIYQ